MQQHRNSNRVMEAGNHFKNGASPKSQMSRGSIMYKILLCFAVFCVNVVNAIAQDIVTLKNGEDIQALVQEIGDVDVKYKKFDNPNGPNYTLKKSEIFMIRYANGSKDVFVDNATPVPTAIPTPAQTEIQQITKRQVETSLEPLSIQDLKIYNSDGVKLSKYEVQNMMRNVPEALDLYNGGNNLRTAGWVFWGAEVGCLGVGLFQLFNSLSNDDENMLKSSMYWSLGSIGLGIPSLICSNMGKNKIKDSVSTYNRGIKQKHTSDVSLNFGITPSGGIGLTLNF